MKKRCSRCHVVKPVAGFNKNKRSKDGYHNQCRECIRAWKVANREHLRAYGRKYNADHREETRVRERRYYEENPSKKLEFSKKYYASHREERSKYNRRYNQANSEKLSLKKREWRRTHSGYGVAYKKKRMKTDVAFRLRNRVAIRISMALRREVKTDKTVVLLGCSMSDLKIYLEGLFRDGMSWDNYGIRGWHMDHRRPCASFDLSDPEEQRRCFHYTNLQPLWAKENYAKGARV